MQMATRPFVPEKISWRVSRSQRAPEARSRTPPHRSTTSSPSRAAANAAPSSSRSVKFRSNSARTPSNPLATVPATSFAICNGREQRVRADRSVEPRMLDYDRNVALDGIGIRCRARELEPADGVRVVEPDVAGASRFEDQLDRAEWVTVLEVEREADPGVAITDVEETRRLVARHAVRRVGRQVSVGDEPMLFSGHVGVGGERRASAALRGSS